MRNPSSKSGKQGAATIEASKTTPCCSKVGLKRGPWTPEEDGLLSAYINREGEGRWRTLPKRAGLLRCGKSCRLRWMNYLRPSVKRGRIAPDEEDLILRLHRLLGNRWSLIAGRIPGRTDNEIKNYWNTHISKKLIGQGIDPRTHKPLDPAPLKLASSSKPKDIDGHNCEPSPVISAGEEISSSSQVVVTAKDKEIARFEDHVEHNADHAPSTVYLDVMVTGCDDGHGMSNDEEDLNCYGGDDVFSSFLNSLITEEAFPVHNGDSAIASSASVIAFTASSSALPLRSDCGSGMMSSAAALDENKTGNSQA
ncbi:hypothetical protein MLD38_017120 [Melastoma candidum]|uniref:Uncharacterized protein n=1 Tax=Melastoma candidum TaxID=119954 RepID=A0ACB9QP00_9MYRT|nr:hypothetical protein MLD38_017120 [Melastoma candidum]